MVAEQIVSAPAQHPSKPSVGSGLGRHPNLFNLLTEMRHPELCLAEGIQLVFIGPLRGKKDARPDQKALEVALGRKSPDLREGEISECGRIPGGVVVGRHGHPPSEPPRGTNVEPVRAEIPGYVRVPATYFQALPSCSRR